MAKFRSVNAWNELIRKASELSEYHLLKIGRQISRNNNVWNLDDLSILIARDYKLWTAFKCRINMLVDREIPELFVMNDNIWSI